MGGAFPDWKPKLYALIASWRERGEALKELVGLAIMPDALTVYNLWPEALERARAALDKP